MTSFDPTAFNVCVNDLAVEFGDEVIQPSCTSVATLDLLLMPHVLPILADPDQRRARLVRDRRLWSRSVSGSCCKMRFLWRS